MDNIIENSEQYRLFKNFDGHLIIFLLYFAYFCKVWDILRLVCISYF